MRAFLARLVRTKRLDAILADAERSEHRLRRTLGAFDVVLLGIGAIIGAGIFATVGTAAAGDALRPGAGPGLILSFALTGIACACPALCYAEFAAMVPISGSAYTYAYVTLGELIAWIIGWDLIIEYAVGNVAVAISWSGYFQSLLEGFGIHLPSWLATNYGTVYGNSDPALSARVLEEAPRIAGLPIIVNLPAAAIVLAITAVLVRGIKESARFNAVMVAVKLLILVFFVLVGAFYVKPDNWRPFAPNGFGGIAAGAAIVFFAYIGFDAISTVSEETRNPRRDMPIGILGSLAVCTVVYIVVAAILTGMVPYQQLASSAADPLAAAFELHGLDAAAGLIAFGAVVATTAVLLVFQLGQPRIFFAMGRDGLLPPVVTRVHPRFHTPHVTTIVTGVVVAGVAAFSSLEAMVDLTNIGTLFAFILVCAGTLILRIREPERQRAFRVPFGPVIPVLGMASCLGLIYYLPPASWTRFGLWLLAGLVIYLAYGRKHSRLAAAERATRPR